MRTGKTSENGQSFTGVAKPYWDQTVGSELKASYIFFFLIEIVWANTTFNGDLGKTVDQGFSFWVAIDWVTCRFFRANVSRGLNVQSGHSNDPQHRVRAVSV